MTEKVKEPSLRQRMVKGTKWRLTEEATISKVKRVPVTYPNGRNGFKDELEDDFKLPAGTEVLITGKSTTYGPSWVTGIWYPISVDGKDLQIQFKELNKKPDQIGEAEAIPLFVIWDTEKQAYYTGHDYDWRSGTNNGITYDAKLAKAKKFKRLADVRVHALIQTGYYDDLPESWGTVPEWMMGRKVYDVPDTWEIIKYDKLTKNEIAHIELVDTFKRSWKLRELTVKFSSTVRQVYSDLEKKKKLDQFSALLMFIKPNDSYWGYWANHMSESDMESVNKLLGRFKDEVKIQKGVTGFAVAIKDAMTATMIRLAYEGDLDCAIIDLATMDEVVNKD
jgi:hypothetical protein